MKTHLGLLEHLMYKRHQIENIKPERDCQTETTEWCSSAFGSWKLEIGSWILDGHSKSGFEIWKLEVTTWKLDLKVGSWIWKLDFGSGSWILEVGFWKLEDGSWKSKVGSWKLEDGSWKSEV